MNKEKRQGKCDICKCAFLWDASYKATIKNSYCGDCYQEFGDYAKLKQTSKFLKTHTWFEAEKTFEDGKALIWATNEVERNNES